MPAVFLPIPFSIWNHYRALQDQQEGEWTLLEVKIPKQMDKSPRSMEQALTGLGGIGDSASVSLEVAGIHGAPHFFIRTPVELIDTIETQIYSQYPRVEIFEVEDYTKDFRENLSERGWQFFGAEMVLQEKDVYPIRTYSDFGLDEEEEEERKVDPLSHLTETMGDLGNNEQLWVQYVISPTTGLEEDAQGEIDILTGRDKEAPKFLEQFLGDLKEAFLAVISLGGGESGDEGGEDNGLLDSEKQLIEMMSEYASKQAFAVTVRVIYAAKQEAFKKGRISAIFGSFGQYARHGVNRFEPTNTPEEGKIFKKKKQKQENNLLFRYKLREHTENPMRLNCEALASLYHFPGREVSVPTLERVPARKVQPPSNLPTAG